MMVTRLKFKDEDIYMTSDRKIHLGKFKLIVAKVKEETEKRKINARARGPHAQTLVRKELYEREWLPSNGHEGNIVDLFAVSASFPLRCTAIQVKSVYIGNDSTHFKEKEILEESGPIYIIAVETNRGEYKYLIFSNTEMKNIVKKRGRLYKKDKKYYLSIPKSLKGFEDYVNRWEKVEKTSFEIRS